MKKITGVAVSATVAAAVLAAASCTNLRTAKISANEASAKVCLKIYLSAQNTFRRMDQDEDGMREFAADMKELYHTQQNGVPIKLIDLSMANADDDGGQGAAPAAKNGYLFHDLKGAVRDGKNEDFEVSDDGTKGYIVECGLLAYPEIPGKTGSKVFVIGIEGTIYEKSAEGVKPFDYLPDCQDPASGWVMSEQ
ncbi:MAG: DUF2950 family protein [Planctomycetes bacterium]|nr:DUF2950 family protein [Planctomycetota bacterium]